MTSPLERQLGYPDTWLPRIVGEISPFRLASVEVEFVHEECTCSGYDADFAYFQGMISLQVFSSLSCRFIDKRRILEKESLIPMKATK
jgi:hypothetical protein